jgi:DNA modification methylase
MEINRIYNESNLATMLRMPDNFIDLTVTSPPYDNLRDYKGFKFPFKHIARHLYRVTKYGGVVVWVVGDATINGSETGTSFSQALFFMQCGFRLHDTMIYQKVNVAPLNHNRYEQEFEYVFVLSKGKPKTVNLLREKCVYAGTKLRSTRRNNNKDDLTRAYGYGNPISSDKVKGNIFPYIVGSANDNPGKHPAVFPQALAGDHIKSWSNEGDLVYDCFGGSGTTAKMAHLLQRKWILSEISTEYCELAAKRLKRYLQQTQLF